MYKYATSSLSIYLSVDIQAASTLATVNSASLKIRVTYLFDLEFSSFSFLDICPGVELLNCTVTLFLFFNFIYPFTDLFLLFWLLRVFMAVHGPSLVAVRGAAPG